MGGPLHRIVRNKLGPVRAARWQGQIGKAAQIECASGLRQDVLQVDCAGAGGETVNERLKHAMHTGISASTWTTAQRDPSLMQPQASFDATSGFSLCRYQFVILVSDLNRIWLKSFPVHGLNLTNVHWPQPVRVADIRRAGKRGSH